MGKVYMRDSDEVKQMNPSIPVPFISFLLCRVLIQGPMQTAHKNHSKLLIVPSGHICLCTQIYAALNWPNDLSHFVNWVGRVKQVLTFSPFDVLPHFQNRGEGWDTSKNYNRACKLPYLRKELRISSAQYPYLSCGQTTYLFNSD